MKYTVTGGAGFIGSNLVDQLIKEGHEVSVVDNLSTGIRSNLNPKASFFNADISEISNESPRGSINSSKIEQALEGSNAVFHLAALARVQPSIKEPVKFNKTNVDGTLNMLLAAHKMGVKRFVYLSLIHI